jgi:hypothetical protein
VTGVELVATALAAGAAPGLTGCGRGTVHDLYVALREAVRRRLAGSDCSSVGDRNSVCGGYGVRVLDAYETDPDVWRTRLLQVLTASGVEMHEECLAAARAVLRAERRTGCITGESDGGPGTERDGGPASRKRRDRIQEKTMDGGDTAAFDKPRLFRGTAPAGGSGSATAASSTPSSSTPSRTVS